MYKIKGNGLFAKNSSLMAATLHTRELNISKNGCIVSLESKLLINAPVFVQRFYHML